MRVYLCLGGNISDRVYCINNAIDLIAKGIGKIISKSSIYETEPWGFDSENYFLNQVIVVETSYNADKILDKINEIEKKTGRVKENKQYADRVTDIDILFIDDLIIENENLIVPHPLLHKRKFVLKPLAEIAGDFVHPVLKKTINQLLEKCVDKMIVKHYL